MIRMRALTRYRHGGVMLRAGDPFTVENDAQARELVAVGFAARADVPAVEQRPAKREPGTYQRRDVRARG